MRVFNSFNEMAVGTGHRVSGGMSVFNMPHCKFGDGIIDFRIELYAGYDDYKDLNPITTEAERNRLYKLLQNKTAPFYAEVPAGSPMFPVEYHGKVLYFTPEAGEVQTADNGVGLSGERLPTGWDTMVLIT